MNGYFFAAGLADAGGEISTRTAIAGNTKVLSRLRFLAIFIPPFPPVFAFECLFLTVAAACKTTTLHLCLLLSFAPE